MPPHILVSGLVGAGKSTVVNAITGGNAETGSTAESVTRAVMPHEGGGFVLWDTPGLGDPEITTKSWCEGADQVSGKRFNLLLYVINGHAPRVDNQQVLLIVALNAIAQLSIDNVAVVFTRASDAKLTDERAKDYLEHLGKKSKKTTFFNTRTPYCFFDFDKEDVPGKFLHDTLPRCTGIQVNDITSNPLKIVKDIMKDAREVNPEVADMVKVFADEATDCFHRDSVVHVRSVNGSLHHQAVGDITVGDRVVCHNPETGEVFDDEVIYTHDHSSDFWSKTSPARFVTMTYITSSGTKGKFGVSNNHFVLRWAPRGEFLLGAAHEVVPGETLAIVTDEGLTEGRIVDVEFSYEPLSNLVIFLTKSRLAVVDGVVASCLTCKWDGTVGRILHPLFARVPMLGRIKELPVVERGVSASLALIRLAGFAL